MEDMYAHSTQVRAQKLLDKRWHLQDHAWKNFTPFHLLNAMAEGHAIITQTPTASGWLQ